MTPQVAYAPVMAHTTAGGLVALLGTGALVLALQVPADGAGATLTRITSPSGGSTFLDRGGSPTMKVSGTTSSDVTTVNVYCVGGSGATVVTTSVATSVPVTAGAFSVTAPVPHATFSPVCRLRAVPQGTDIHQPLSAFSGPVVHLDRLQRLTLGAATFDFDLTAGSGAGAMEVHSAGDCGNAMLGVVPDDQSTPFEFGGCVASLGPPTVAGSAPPLRVDGHLAQLPFSVLDADASALRLTVHTAKTGRVTWTESAPLVRCSGTGSCGTPTPTGVTFVRSGTFSADGHQIALRDSFTSTDGAKHRVQAVYGMGWNSPPTGALGFAFPGHGGGFHGSTAGQVVTGFTKRAATFVVRSDRFAGEGDPMAATRAVTWSRPPSRIAFATDDGSLFGMSYSLQVPKKGSVRLGFTDSDALRTSSARAMGARAVADVMRKPTITSPADGAVVVGRKTVVKGVVRAGVNGLPVSVKVNGHPATITATSGNRATYRVVFHEPGGKHTLTTVAKDAGGNARSASITVRNK
jgi:hypothetical protein